MVNSNTYKQYFNIWLLLMFLTVVITFDYIKGKKQEEIKNFNTVVKSKEFLNLGNYFKRNSRDIPKKYQNKKIKNLN